jgi:hypothetical protein
MALWNSFGGRIMQYRDKNHYKNAMKAGEKFHRVNECGELKLLGEAYTV